MSCRSSAAGGHVTKQLFVDRKCFSFRTAVVGFAHQTTRYALDTRWTFGSRRDPRQPEDKRGSGILFASVGLGRSDVNRPAWSHLWWIVERERGRERAGICRIHGPHPSMPHHRQLPSARSHVEGAIRERSQGTIQLLAGHNSHRPSQIC